jgi:hypothetical protein
MPPDARPALATYPRRLMSGSSIPGGQRHEGHFASTIDIGGQVVFAAGGNFDGFPRDRGVRRPEHSLTLCEDRAAPRDRGKARN